MKTDLISFPCLSCILREQTSVQMHEQTVSDFQSESLSPLTSPFLYLSVKELINKISDSGIQCQMHGLSLLRVK